MPALEYNLVETRIGENRVYCCTDYGLHTNCAWVLITFPETVVFSRHLIFPNPQMKVLQLLRTFLIITIEKISLEPKNGSYGTINAKWVFWNHTGVFGSNGTIKKQKWALFVVAEQSTRKLLGPSSLALAT